MSEDNQQSVIANAGAIIKRFGGIRPMSKTTGIPVTTIQGWKKRDIIPATRREEIRSYARDNTIAIDDLLDVESSDPQPEDGRAGQDQPQDTDEDVLDLGKARAVQNDGTHPGRTKETRESQTGPNARKPRPGGAQSAFMGQMAMIVTTVLIAVLALGGFMFWPDLKKVPEQNTRITKLEHNVEQVDRKVEKIDRKVTQVKDKQGYLDSLVPKDLKSQLSGLQRKTRKLREKTGNLSRQMTGMSADDVQSYAKNAVSTENFRKLRSRVGELEQRMRQYAEDAGMSSISNFMTRLNAMQNAEAGRKQLSQATSQIFEMLQNTGGDTQKLKQALMLKKGENDALGKTLEGVKDENMKATAMLMAFSNLRSALARDRSSFRQDLELMKQLINDEDKELNQAINRLAPEAKDGVLTPSGLSREFRSLSGEIVAASLRGKDVSITDKAKARLNDILSVKKDGREVTGTKEQKLVAKAKRKLDKGDVNGALKALRQLEGKPAKKAKPFIEKAEARALADKLKEKLGRQVMQQLSTSAPAPSSGPAQSDVPAYDAGADMRFRPKEVQPENAQEGAQ